MVINYRGNKIRRVCACGEQLEHDIRDLEIEFDEDLGEYRNLALSCSCGVVEVLNMNLPDDLEEYDFVMESGMPFAELNQRKLVRDIAREHRKSKKQATVDTEVEE